MDRDVLSLMFPPIISCADQGWPTLQGALKDGFGEAVVANKQFKFPSLDSYQKRLLWTQKEVDFAPHSVVGLVLQIGDAEKFPQALGFQSLVLFFFFQSQQIRSMFHNH